MKVMNSNVNVSRIYCRLSLSSYFRVIKNILHSLIAYDRKLDFKTKIQHKAGYVYSRMFAINKPYMFADCLPPQSEPRFKQPPSLVRSNKQSPHGLYATMYGTRILNHPRVRFLPLLFILVIRSVRQFALARLYSRIPIFESCSTKEWFATRASKTVSPSRRKN